MEKQNNKIILTEEEYSELIIFKNNAEILQKELFNEKFNAEKANLEISVLKCSKEGHFRITMIFMAIGLLAGFYGGCLMNKLSVPTQILIFLLMLGTGLLTAYLVKPKNKKEKIKEEIQ